MTDNSETALEQAVLEQSREADGKRRLDCSLALALAAQFEVAPPAVCRICNRHGIKIGRCQLGCFK